MLKLDIPIDADYLDNLHEWNISSATRELYLFGEEGTTEDGEEPGVDYTMASRLIRNITFLNRISSKPILIHMKTCGGDCVEGLAIYDAIKMSKSPTTILNYSHARSMSSIILQAATKRVMMPHSYFMYHHGDYAIDNDWVRAQSEMEFDNRFEGMMTDAYIERMVTTKGRKYYGKKPSVVCKMLLEQMQKKGDVFLTAAETLEHGLADEIFDGNWAKL